MKVEPYVFFNGRCEEAIEFYKSALGAQVVMLMRFKDAPPPPPGADTGGCAPPSGAMAEKVMHATLRIGESTVMASDGDGKGAAKFDGFSLSVSAKNDAEAERLFAALADGGKVVMPLTKTFFSSRFGMVNDRFGIAWMVVVEHKAA